MSSRERRCFYYVGARSARTSFLYRHPATSAIYTLSLHDALPISPQPVRGRPNEPANVVHTVAALAAARGETTESLARSEEHTSELQSRVDLVCRLLLEKKKCTSAN